ncbi:MAG: exonuclease domain-containing protein [Eubacterium sp.]
MNYIIFDLEWNNAYNYKTKTGINEIIEIGAVKLNHRLDIVDTFKQLLKPRISKKLGSRFKNLTHITNEEIKENGIDFEDAFADFARWCGAGEKVFLSWSNSDLYTLADNFKRFTGSPCVSFMDNYADAQKYCMNFIKDSNAANQISLSNCAQLFEIDIDTSNLHRALEDCFVTAYCFKKVFDKEIFKDFVSKCDTAFFEKLIFRPFYIKKPVYDNFNINNVEIICPDCSGTIKTLIPYEFSNNNNTFKSAGQCQQCRKKYWIFVRAKQNYDKISVSQRIVSINKKRARHIN